MQPHHERLVDLVLSNLATPGGFRGTTRAAVTDAVHRWSTSRDTCTWLPPAVAVRLKAARAHVARLQGEGRTCDAYDLQALLDDLSAHLSTGPVVAAVARRVEDLELTAPADPRLALIEQLTQEDAAAELAEPCSANLFNALVDEEFRLACSRHPPLHSPHEALAVLEEEVSELREEVYRRHETRNYTAMLKELIQVAAVCRRFSANLGLLRVADQLAAVLDRPSRPVDRVTAPAPLPGARAGFLASDGV